MYVYYGYYGAGMSCALELSKTNTSKKHKWEKKVGEVIKYQKTKLTLYDYFKKNEIIICKWT